MKMIQAVCCVFPSGECLWFEADKGSEYLSKVIISWREQNPEYVETESTSGLVEIRMPEDKYREIVATNSFNWPSS